MDPQFPPLATDTEMAEQQARHMVENSVVGPASPEAWMVVVATQQ